MSANWVFKADKIISKRLGKDNKVEYCVKWHGWNEIHNTWEPEENIFDRSLIDTYEQSVKDGSGKPPSPKLNSIVQQSTTAAPKIQQRKTIIAPTPLSPNVAPPSLWLKKCKLNDEVLITDVTVNSVTVTIRECKTTRGFFRDRTGDNEN